jgi:NADH:ubiquinone oxidoreductase subunit E
MSEPKNGPPVDQPKSFAFTPENLEKAKTHIGKYPPGRQASAVLPLQILLQP